MSRPSYFEPYQVPPGYFDEEILLLEGVRKHADAHGNIDVCTLARTSWPKNQFITDTFEKLAEKVRAGLQANERAGGRK